MVYERGASSSAKENTPLLPKFSPSSTNNRLEERLSSVPKSFGNVVIAVVGSGVLGLPYTFMKTGWLSGAIMLGMVAGITYYCMLLLIWTKKRLISDGYGKISSFGDVGFLTCGSCGKAMVDAMIILSQGGFCVSYLIFIGTTISSILFSQESMLNQLESPLLSMKSDLHDVVISFLHETTFLGISIKACLIWCQLPFQLGLNAIRSLTLLAPFSIFADIVDIAAMVAVMVDNVIKFVQHTTQLNAFTSWSMIPYGVGVAIFAFEGIGMVIPLETEAENKSKFGSILGISITLITITYGSFGLLGYFAYGSATQDIITLNMGQNIMTTIVKLALCINLFFSCPLMMNPVHEVLESRFNGGRYSFFLRSLAVLSITLVALMVPNFSDFLSLAGSSACCMLGFVLPATFHMVACRDNCSKTEIVVDVLIICFGSVFGILGTISSVNQIFFSKTVV